MYFFKYSSVSHQKKRLEPLMNKLKSVLPNIEKCESYGGKTIKKGQNGKKLDFSRFFVTKTSAFFNILQNGFLLGRF